MNIDTLMLLGLSDEGWAWLFGGISTLIAAVLTGFGTLVKIRYDREFNLRQEELHDRRQARQEDLAARKLERELSLHAEQEADKRAAQFMEQILAESKLLRSDVMNKNKIIHELQVKLQTLTTEVHELREELDRFEKTRATGDSTQILECLVNNLPYAISLHEIGANQWFVNDCFAKIFHVHRRDFWTPINLTRSFSVEKSAGFISNDLYVIESNTKQTVQESLPVHILEPEDIDKNPCVELTAVKIPIVAGTRSYVLTFKYLRDQEPSITI